jgi:preprotein translocase subunit SecD
MRACFQSALPAIVLLGASCSPSQTATTRPAAEKPKGVLEFRVLATKDDPDAYKFSDYREALTQRGDLSLADGPAYRWFAIKDPADFFKSKNLKDEFDGIRKSRPEIAERRVDDYYILAHTAGDHVMTNVPGAPAWSVKTARVIRSTRGYTGIGVDLDDAGKSQLEKLAQSHQGRPLGIFLDDHFIMHAAVMDVITKGITIHGSFSPSEAEETVKLLRKTSTPQ